MTEMEKLDAWLDKGRKEDLAIHALLGEVCGATGIHSSILLEDDTFRQSLVGFVVKQEVPFHDAKQKLIEYANDNY
jgi:hypothetical protein